MARRSLAVSVVAFVVAFIAAASSAQGPVVSLEGDWEFISASERGKPLPDAMITTHIMRGTKTTIAVWSTKNDKELPGSKLDYKILDGKNIDVSQTLPSPKKDAKPGETVTLVKRGIYELKGDMLKLAWMENTGAEGRPENFDGGGGVFAAVLKRKAK